MGNFPRFKDGKLLFCGGKLAASCCPDYFGGGWESHGQPFKDPTCSPPTDWDGQWMIGTVCGGLTCAGSRPKVGVSVNWNSVCTYYGAVLTDWLLGRVSIDMGVAPFDAIGYWTVWGAGCGLSKEVTFVKGQSAQFEFILPEGCGDIFGTEGRVELKSRMTVDFPGIGLKDHDSTVYLYVEAYAGDRVSGELVIYPSLMAADAAQLIYARIIEDGDRKYSLLISDLKGGFATGDRAYEVLNGFEEALANYADRCACDCFGETSDPICTSGVVPANWNGKWSPGFAGCETEPAGSSCASMQFTWGVDMTGSGYSFALRVKDVEDGSWHTLAEGEAPGSIYCEGIIPPCGVAEAVLVANDASGEYFFGGEFWPVGTSNTCTDSIREAFNLVPND